MSAEDPAEPAAPENFTCPHCQKEIEAAEIARWNAGQMGKKGGAVKSKKKAASSAENGKKGGRPKKIKPSAETQD